jgi:nitrate reductase molybdenum cofactor assembly chaperone NarJ/NarW
MRALKLIGLLLLYPDRELRVALADLAAALTADPSLPAAHRPALAGFARALAAMDPYEVEETYVALFDRTRTLSLHLFEHAFGDSRTRGQAMVALGERYRQAGLEPDPRELPDFLPLFLEFLSMLPAAEALPMLKEAAPVLDKIRAGLVRRESGYAAAFAALLAIAELPATAVDDAPAEDEFAAMDREWEEAAVTFGPGDGGGPQAEAGCGRASEMVRRMHPAAS